MKMIPRLYLLFQLTFFCSHAQVSPGGVSTGLSLWYKSDAGVTTSTGVSVWADQSGNLRNLLQGSANAQPVYNTTSNLINFQPTIGFDGSNDFLQNSALPQAFTVNNNQSSQYVVYRSRQNGSPGIYQHSDNAGGAFNLGAGGDWMLVTNRFSSISLAPVVNNEARLQSLQGSTNGNVDTRVNGTTFSTSWNSFTGSAGTQPFTVGGTSYSAYSASDIAEIIIYPNATNASNERQRIESYLALKYGMTLPFNYLSSDNSTLIWDVTANATYNSNIAGIGRDDNSGLLQKQSQSSNSGNQIIVALGTVAASNQANTASFSANRQFVVWGDNNLTGVSDLSDVANSTIYNRLNRVWKLTRVGNANQNIQLLIPKKLTSNNTTATLCYNTSSPLFASGNTYATTSTITSINGADYFVFNLSTSIITSNFYFTLTNVNFSPGGVSADLSLWYKADLGVINSTGVANWEDQSGNSRNLLQATTIARPAHNTLSNLINFQPTVGFDGLNDFLQIPALPQAATVNNNQSSQYIVYRSRQNGSLNIYQHSDNAAGTFNIGAGGNWMLVANRYSSISSAPVVNNEARLQSLQGNTNGNVDTRVNGTTFSTSWNSFTAGAGTQPFTVGAETSNSYFAFDVAEMIIYPSSANSSNERQRVESYLALKYGATLPFSYLASDNSTVFWDHTANATYKNNIAGIGRDDNSGLLKKQSQSINSGDQIIVALNTFEASDQANNALFTANKQFLVCGDNASNASNTSFFDSSTGNSYERLSRVWFADNTGGFSSNIQILVPISLAFSTSTVYFIVSSTSNFASGTNTYLSPSSLEIANGLAYYVINLTGTQVSNDFYFTLAFIDSDKDTFSDQVDLDDDNDGITDNVENSIAEGITNGSFSSGTTGWTLTGNTSLASGVIAFNGGDLTPNGVLSQNVSVYANNLSTLSFFVNRQGFGTGTVALLIQILEGNTVLNSTIVSKTAALSGTSHTLSFISSTNSVTIRFTDISTSTASIDITLDDVSLMISNFADTDEDGIDDYLDLDSDGDGCSDAIEGGANFTFNDMVFSNLPGGNSGSSYIGTSTNPVVQNLGTTVGSTTNTIGIPIVAATGQTVGSSKNGLIRDNNCLCSQPSTSGTPSTADLSITGRNANFSGWPQNIPNAAIALDSQDKGFVITRLTTTEINNMANPIEGMLVFDKTLQVLKLYKGPANGGWVIINPLTCY